MNHSFIIDIFSCILYQERIILYYIIGNETEREKSCKQIFVEIKIGRSSLLFNRLSLLSYFRRRKVENFHRFLCSNPFQRFASTSFSWRKFPFNWLRPELERLKDRKMGNRSSYPSCETFSLDPRWRRICPPIEPLKWRRRPRSRYPWRTRIPCRAPTQMATNPGYKRWTWMVRTSWSPAV